MTQSTAKLLIAISVGLLNSCDSHTKNENAEVSAPEHQHHTSSHPDSTHSHENRHPADPKHESQTAALEKLTAELEQMPDAQSKRSLFGDILLSLPHDEHDLAVNAVIQDMGSASSANLLLEYLEFSEMLPPTLQLPAMARLLQEDTLLPIQRAAMAQQLRETLKLSPDSQVTDWQPLITEHLKRQPGVIVDQ